jgi:hypothetical protein
MKIIPPVLEKRLFKEEKAPGKMDRLLEPGCHSKNH